MFKFQKLLVRLGALGVLSVSLGFFAGDGLAVSKAKYDCQSCEYEAGMLELCRWNKPRSGDCSIKPSNASCVFVEECPPIYPE